MPTDGDILDELFYATDLLDKLLGSDSFKAYVAVSDSTKEEALKSAFDHLNLHNDTYGIEANTTDVYKFLSWYGHFLYRHADDRFAIIYLATIRVLNNEILAQEKCKKGLSKTLLDEMYKMLTKDGGDEDHLAIGKNGLYISFKTAQNMCISFHEQCLETGAKNNTPAVFGNSESKTYANNDTGIARIL